MRQLSRLSKTLAAYYVRADLLKMVTLKLLDTYGPNGPRPKLFTLFECISSSGERLKMSPGEQRLGLVYIDDVVDAFLMAGEYIETLPDRAMPSYIIAPVHLYSLREIAALYEAANGKRLEHKLGRTPIPLSESYGAGARLPTWRQKLAWQMG